jgi:glycosyltransferase involved in cell wall biosynthesis
MRIAIVTESWLPSVNGMVTRLSATVRELTARGHEVLVVSVTSTGDYHGARVVTMPSFTARIAYPGQQWGWPSLRFLRIFREFDPDIVHVVNPAWMGGSAVFAARMLRRTVVCSYHTDLLAYADFYKLGWLRWLMALLLRTIHNAAHRNLVTSRHMERVVTRMGFKRVHLWPRGIDADQFAVPRTPREAGAPIEVLSVGRLAKEKHLESLMTLAATPGIHLTFLGDGPHRAELEARFASTDATFAGTLRGADLAAAYAAADVFALPSLTETLGLVLLEALAAGLPIVAAESPASIELLDGCPAARLYDDADDPSVVASLAAELVASATSDDLAAIARHWLGPYSWSTATDSVLGFYRLARTPRAALTVPRPFPAPATPAANLD